jgi:hypothetical protein
MEEEVKTHDGHMVDWRVEIDQIRFFSKQMGCQRRDQSSLTTIN